MHKCEIIIVYLSLVVRKPAFCICENKDADQLRGNREADQRLCFRYTDSTFPLLPKYEISSLQPSAVVVQPGLCRTWSETPKTGFLTTGLSLFKTTDKWQSKTLIRKDEHRSKTIKNRVADCKLSWICRLCS